MTTPNDPSISQEPQTPHSNSQSSKTLISQIEPHTDNSQSADDVDATSAISPRTAPPYDTYSRRGSKRKRTYQRRNAEKKSREKFQVLVETLKPIPFVPAKNLDFMKHEALLRRLGLWDFVHVEFDRSIRCDLVAQLIAGYTPSSRSSYVNGMRIMVNRADLGRALRLPVKKPSVVVDDVGDGGDDLEMMKSAEAVCFVEEVVENWMLLHEDTVIMPPEVLSIVKMVKEGDLERVDWAGLIWQMVEKELKTPQLVNCYYASHLQQLIKVQREQFLKEEPKVETEVEEEEEEDYGSSGLKMSRAEDGNGGLKLDGVEASSGDPKSARVDSDGSDPKSAGIEVGAADPKSAGIEDGTTDPKSAEVEDGGSDPNLDRVEDGVGDAKFGRADACVDEKLARVEDVNGDLKLSGVEDVSGESKLGVVEDVSGDPKLVGAADGNGNLKMDVVEDGGCDTKTDEVEDGGGYMKADGVDDVGGDTKMDGVDDVGGDTKMDGVEDGSGDTKMDGVDDGSGDTKTDRVEDGSLTEMDGVDDGSGDMKMGGAEDGSGDVKMDGAEDGSGDVKMDGAADGSGVVKMGGHEDGSGDSKTGELEDGSDDLKVGEADDRSGDLKMGGADDGSVDLKMDEVDGCALGMGGVHAGNLRMGAVDSGRGQELEEHNIELSLGQDNAEKVEVEKEPDVGEHMMNKEEFKEKEPKQWLLDRNNSSVMDIEELKEEEPEQWLLDRKNNGGEPFLRKCNFSDVNGLDGESKKEEGEGQEGGEDEGEEEEEEDEEEAEEDDYEGGFHLNSKCMPLEGMSSGGLMQAMETGQMAYNSGIELRDNSIGDFLSSREDAHMISGPSIFNNGHKRDIGQDNNDSHHSLNGSSKRLRSDSPWNAKPADFEMCMEQIEHWMGKARMMHAEKEQSCEQLSMNQQVLMNELQKRNTMIDNLHKANVEESQKRQMEVYRLEKELYMMSNLVDGYRKALKETQKAFSEYRSKCPQADEPLYKDVPGSGGLVLSVMELEKERLKQAEEQRMKRLMIEKKFRDFEGGWNTKLEDHLNGVQLLADRLLAIEAEVKDLNELNAKRKVSDPPECPPSGEETVQ